MSFSLFGQVAERHIRAHAHLAADVGHQRPHQAVPRRDRAARRWSGNRPARASSKSTVRTMPVPPHFWQAPCGVERQLLRATARRNARRTRADRAPCPPQQPAKAARSARSGSGGWLGARTSAAGCSEAPCPCRRCCGCPGTPGRWCSASAAGTYSTSSTLAFDACVMRRRV